MEYLGEDIKERREEVSKNIVKGFSNSDGTLEKAHNQGDIHPNGKWYWESSANKGKGDWRTIKRAGDSTPAVSTKSQPKEEGKKENENKQPVITVKQAFANIQSLNPSTSTVSSLGTFVSSQSQQLSDNKRREIMGYLPKDSLAYKICISADKFSEKQLWCIAYELIKNKEYQRDLAASIKEIERREAARKAKNAAKRAAKKQAKETAANAMKQYDNIESDDKVKHPIFGEGKVLSQTEDRIKIFFKNHGEKEMLKKFTPLEKI